MLTQRLDRLEREVRWWKLFGGSAMALLGLVLLIAATGVKVADAIRTKRFVLVDTNGKRRAEWGVSTAGAVGLNLYGKDGTTGRAGLAVDVHDVPRLYLASESGRRGVLLSSGIGSSAMELYNSESKPSLRVMLWVNAAPHIEIYEDGNAIWKAP